MATKSTGSRNGTKKSAATTRKNTGSNSRSAAPARKSTRSNGKGEDMPNSKFHQLFMDELKDIYWAEKHLVKALGKMQKAASSQELVNAFADHLEMTKEHVSRVEEVFELMGMKPTAKKCEAMEGLVAEAQELISEEEESSVLDAGLIIAAQKVEHYEIAAYGSLRTLANRMGHTDAAAILEQTLDEEKETDSLLTQIAESSVNEEAMAE
ncbi:ferritin-like domain-containing protein [Chitinophaga sp. GCM10012297]|uniref:Ferritin-like domain-containing protein n=1 Tax=Chitinophaga chungangae TaxID=2821488 RepID=A0ABS3YED1_9BACT|nr:ferritin-like domain-containing protein [Chitinophaga chungangae]MBO9153035.1 ferritin-like domain-containing protein [Chitinophaga chungangae]